MALAALLCCLPNPSTPLNIMPILYIEHNLVHFYINTLKTAETDDEFAALDWLG